MPEQTITFLVCSACKGVIPANADRISRVSGRLQIGGVETDFNGLDFCSTAHMFAWLQQTPVVATPSPLYQSPSGNVPAGDLTP